MQLCRLFICSASLTAFISLLHLVPTLYKVWPLPGSWLLLIFGLLQLVGLLVFALLVSMLEKNQGQIKTGLISPEQGQ